MADITTTTAAVFLPTIWSTDVLLATEKALVAANLVRRYDYAVKARGQAIRIPSLANLSVTAKSANTDIVPQANTETSVTLNVDKWYYSAVLIEDMVTFQSNYDLRSLYAEKAGYAVAQQVDSDVLALYTGLTTTDVGAYGTDMDDAEFVGAILQLGLGDVPMENRAFIITPYQQAAIMKIDKFVKADFLGRYQDATPVVTGPDNRHLWGDIYGIPVYVTNNVQTSAGTPTQYHNLLIHKEAFALAMQAAPRLQAQYLVLSLGWIVAVDTIYGVTTIRPTFGVECRS